MVTQQLLTAETDIIPRVLRRVYCAEDSPLRFADGTPLHLEWFIEGPDGKLYTVPSQPGGWLRRRPYQGEPELHRLKWVSSEKADLIMSLTGADVGEADSVRAGRHTTLAQPAVYTLDQWAY